MWQSTYSYGNHSRGQSTHLYDGHSGYNVDDEHTSTTVVVKHIYMLAIGTMSCLWQSYPQTPVDSRHTIPWFMASHMWPIFTTIETLFHKSWPAICGQCLHQSARLYKRRLCRVLCGTLIWACAVLGLWHPWHVNEAYRLRCYRNWCYGDKRGHLGTERHRTPLSHYIQLVGILRFDTCYCCTGF